MVHIRAPNKYKTAGYLVKLSKIQYYEANAILLNGEKLKQCLSHFYQRFIQRVNGDPTFIS